jgi:hypothetical protein
MKIVVLIMGLSFGLISSCSQNLKKMENTVNIKNAKVIEYVTFKTKPGISIEEVLESAKSTDAILDQIEGFSHRFISIQDNGLWVETVFWESIELAQKGLTLFLENPDSKKFLENIMDDSVKIEYSTIL